MSARIGYKSGHSFTFSNDIEDEIRGAFVCDPVVGRSGDQWYLFVCLFIYLSIYFQENITDSCSGFSMYDANFFYFIVTFSFFLSFFLSSRLI